MAPMARASFVLIDRAELIRAATTKPAPGRYKHPVYPHTKRKRELDKIRNRTKYGTERQRAYWRAYQRHAKAMKELNVQKS